MKEIIPKLLELISKPISEKLLKQQIVLDFLKRFNITMLSDDFDSIYANSLVEYGIDTMNSELTKLFADFLVKDGLYNEIYKNSTEEFLKSVFYVFNEKISGVDNPTFNEDYLQRETTRFREYFDSFSKKVKSPFELQKFNNDRMFQTEMLQKINHASFHYQAKQYFKRILSNSLPDKYVELDGIELCFENFEGFKKFGKIDNALVNYSGWLQNDIRSLVTGINLQFLLKSWLKSEDKLLIVVGEYGTGKTTSLQHFQATLLDLYFKGKEEIQQPIIFNLRNFEKTIEAFVVNELNRYGITDINYESFYQKIENGELLLLFDGFDEMTNQIDTDEKVKNFYRIKKLLDASKAKIIITVRKEYFTTQNEFYNTFNLHFQKHYKIIEILPFNDSQIKDFLVKSSVDEQSYWKKIKEIFDLYDLAKRPVLLDLIIKYLPDLLLSKEESNIKSVDLYTFCIQSELKRKDVDLEFIVPSRNRLTILKDVCFQMFQSNTLIFHITDIKLNLRQYFKVENAWEYEKYINEFLSFTFLLFERDDVFRISHKSFRDYLVALYFYDKFSSLDTSDTASFGNTQSTLEVDHFLMEMGLTQLQVTLQMQSSNQFSDRKENVDMPCGYFISNCINWLLKVGNPMYKKNLDFNKPLIDLSSCFLTDILALMYIEVRVNELNLSGNAIANLSTFKFMVRLNIKNLNLDGNLISDISILSYHKTLTKISLNNTMIDSTIELSDFTNLEDLSIENCNLNSVLFLTNLSNLRRLSLADNQISDISDLIKLTKLEYLDIQNNKLNSIDSIIPLSSLITINLKGNDILIEDLQYLKMINSNLKLDVSIPDLPVKEIMDSMLPWKEFLKANLNENVPKEMGAKQGYYYVRVSFLIEENGSLSEIKYQNDPGFGTAAEAIRVINESPKLKPHMVDGKPTSAKAIDVIMFEVK